MRLVFATHNPNKAKEVSVVLKDTGWQIVTLEDIGFHEEIIEDGATLKENAWIKAETIYKLIGENVISDDTGLEVDALKGAPGVHSARYAGSQRSSEDNMNMLLLALDGHSNRSAQFRTVVACIVNGERHECEGVVRGHIAKEKTGAGGFGYDPIFIPEGYKESFGVLDASIKNSISHRARVFLNCRNLLLSLQQ
ncbi:MAG: XTP/dITP diphosphohydrolase [Saprospiraceae bacterium]|jgi:XTP/dITP diphosphohydrolase